MVFFVLIFCSISVLSLNHKANRRCNIFHCILLPTLHTHTFPYTSIPRGSTWHPVLTPSVPRLPAAGLLWKCARTHKVFHVFILVHVRWNANAATKDFGQIKICLAVDLFCLTWKWDVSPQHLLCISVDAQQLNLTPHANSVHIISSDWITNEPYCVTWSSLVIMDD